MMMSKPVQRRLGPPLDCGRNTLFLGEHVMVGPHSNETWRPVLGYEGLYSVSDFGAVRREKPRQRPVALVTNRDGYKIVTLWRDGRGRCFQVHRIVAAAFIGPCPRRHQVNHIDGVKTHNGLANLEYVTARQNNRHAMDVLGKHQRGERCHYAKLTADAVRGIRAMVEGGALLRQAAEKFNTTVGNVHCIVTRKSWAHVA